MAADEDLHISALADVWVAPGYEYEAAAVWVAPGYDYQPVEQKDHWVTIDDDPVLIRGDAPEGTAGYGGGRDRSPIPSADSAGREPSPASAGGKEPAVGERGSSSPQEVLHALSAASSLSDQTSALQVALPNTHIDLDHYDHAETAGEVKMLGDLAQHYPDVAKALTVFGTASSSQIKSDSRLRNVNAWTDLNWDDGTAAMYLSNGFRTTDSSADKMSAQGPRGAADHWGPPESSQPGFTTAHEFGHALFAHALAGKSPEEQGQLLSPLDRGLTAENTSALSRYAATSPGEAFAEAFGAYYLGSHDPAPMAVGRFVQQAYGSAPRRDGSGLKMAELKYSDDQPRDENGRWTDGGGGSDSGGSRGSGGLDS